jgi:toxin ParE1/3/4
MSFRLSSRALIDLQSIVDYISDFNPNAAHRLVDRLEDRWHLLATQPRSGALRQGLGDEFRQVVVGDYLSIYRLDGDDIEIVRVLHGHRNVTDEEVTG